MTEKIKNAIKRMVPFTSIVKKKLGRNKKTQNFRETIIAQRHQGGKRIKDGYGNVCARYCSCGKIHPLANDPKGSMDVEKTMAIKNKIA